MDRGVIGVGRLFRKIFLGFWLTLLLIGVGVGAVVHFHNQRRLAEMSALLAGPRAERNVVAVAAALRYGGVDAVRALAGDWPGRRGLPVLAVDGGGRDLLGRTVPAVTLVRARERLGGARRAPGLRRVAAPDGREYLLFVPAEVLPRLRPYRHRALRPDPFVTRLGIALLASLLFSAGLAWYLARPVRHLRRASHRLAEGALDTRVMPLMGGRRDEIAELGRDFDHMAGRLQALVGAQKRLLHDVSHELRSPLARLQVAVALAHQQPEKTAAALARIEREIGRLDDLVGQLLTLSRLEVGVGAGAAEYVDLTALLESIVEDARFEAGAAGRRVELRTAGEAVVSGRAELLRRAFENVIRNGVKYTAQGAAVEVTVEREAAGERLLVSVCDRGPGVSEAQLETLFEPFVRATEEEPGGRYSGYGLGLAITRRAIDAHGGDVAAQNRPGGGLCVNIRLPVAEDFPTGSK